MRSAKLMIVACVLSAGCGKSQPPTAPTTISPPTSEPSAERPGQRPAPELGELFSVANFTIQMPVGYTLQSQRQRGETISATWQPPGDMPIGPIILSISPAREEGQIPPFEQLRTMLGLIEIRDSEPETVAIGDSNFERVTITCTEAKARHKLRGFQYVSIGRPHILMTFLGGSEDEDSYWSADAAAQSLRAR